MKTKTWILLFAVLLVIFGGLSVYTLLPREASTHAEILSDGQIMYTVDLRVDREICISNGSGGRNAIAIKDGKIGVTEANCPDHYCMHRGMCSSGTDIVCLPNRLVIRFLGEQAVDAAVG